MSDPQHTPHPDEFNTKGVPGPTEESDTASGGAPEPLEAPDDPVSEAARHNDTDPDLGAAAD